jgi:hypothetical protein
MEVRMTNNNRDAGSGAMPTKFDADTSDQVSQEAQKEGMLTESRDGSANSKSQPGRHTPSPSTEKVSGAGPAIAEHSKDAKAPKGGRQVGAYVKK